MISFSDYINDGSTTSVLIIGYPGTGKTTLATQLPAPYILECDNNIAGPFNFVTRKGLKKDAVFDIPHIDEKGVIVPRSKRFDRYAKLCSEAVASKSFKTIVTDSLTTWRDYVEDKVRVLQKKSIAGEAGALKDEPLSQPDWGVLYGVAKQQIINLKSCGIRSVFLAHIETRKDELHKNEDKATLMKYLAFPGQLRESMSGLFDEVWVLESVQKTTSKGTEYVRVLRTVPSDFREAGLGLKTATDMGYKFELNDFNLLNAKLGEQAKRDA